MPLISVLKRLHLNKRKVTDPIILENTNPETNGLREWVGRCKVLEAESDLVHVLSRLQGM